MANGKSIDEVMRVAAGLPLYDAAYKLWVSRREYSALEIPAAVPKPRAGESVDRSTIQKVVRGLTAAVSHEISNAANGKISEILRAAHPDVSDAGIKVAIQTAIDFERACISNFKYTKGGSLSEDVDRAIEAAKAAHPQFQEDTYRHASFVLALAMR